MDGGCGGTPTSPPWPTLPHPMWRGFGFGLVSFFSLYSLPVDSIKVGLTVEVGVARYNQQKEYLLLTFSNQHEYSDILFTLPLQKYTYYANGNPSECQSWGFFVPRHKDFPCKFSFSWVWLLFRVRRWVTNLENWIWRSWTLSWLSLSETWQLLRLLSY